MGELHHDGSAVGAGGTLARLGLLGLINHGLVPSRFVVPAVDVFHASNLMRRPPKRARLTATIHDLTSWLMPGLHRKSTLRADRLVAERVWSRSDGLIAVSETSKRAAVEVLRLAPDRITVIHNGVDKSYFRLSALAIEEFRRVYQIRGSYILFVSTVEPRKNLDALITAYEQLSAEVRHEFQLLVAGPLGWDYEATLHRMRNNDKGVRYLGYIPEHYLPAMFASATLFVYPSLYEGFGLPILQAMAAGTPVLASAAGALPEVAGDGAAWVDPHSTDDMREGLRSLLLSESRRAILSQRGRLRAGVFTWETCARQTWAFFRNVSSGTYGSPT